jgi:hypothetical protein
VSEAELLRTGLGTKPRRRPRYRWLDPYGAARFIATNRESSALAFLDSSTEIAEVFQEDAATVLAMTEVVLDNLVSILDDLHDLQGSLPPAIIHRIEDLVQLAGEVIFEKVKRGKHPLRLVRLIPFRIVLDGQAKGLEAAVGIVGMVVRQPLYPGNDAPPGAASTRPDDKLHTQHGSDVGHGNSNQKLPG